MMQSHAAHVMLVIGTLRPAHTEPSLACNQRFAAVQSIPSEKSRQLLHVVPRHALQGTLPNALVQADKQFACKKHAGLGTSFT